MKAYRTSLALGIAACCIAMPVVASADSGAASAPSGRASGQTDTATYRAKGVTSQALKAGTTHNWGAKRGWWILNLNGLPVTAGQAVTVSATEIDGAGNEFIGGAPTYCQNVAVTQNRVSARCLFDWGTPIQVRLHYVY